MIYNNFTSEMEETSKRIFFYTICCLESKMWKFAYIKTNEKLMGHRKKPMNMSCDILWKKTILHSVTCFVSHYTNDFSFPRVDVSTTNYAWKHL